MELFTDSCWVHVSAISPRHALKKFSLRKIDEGQSRKIFEVLHLSLTSDFWQTRNFNFVGLTDPETDPHLARSLLCDPVSGGLTFWHTDWHWHLAWSCRCWTTSSVSGWPPDISCSCLTSMTWQTDWPDKQANNQPTKQPNHLDQWRCHGTNRQTDTQTSKQTNNLLPFFFWLPTLVPCSPDTLTFTHNLGFLFYCHWLDSTRCFSATIFWEIFSTLQILFPKMFFVNIFCLFEGLLRR